jgi:hypothetical protein
MRPPLGQPSEPTKQRPSSGGTQAGREAPKRDRSNFKIDGHQRLTMLQQQGQSGGNAVSSKEVDLAYNALGQFTSIADFNYLNGGPRMDIATGGYSYDTGNRLTGLAYAPTPAGTTSMPLAGVMTRRTMSPRLARTAARPPTATT